MPSRCGHLRRRSNPAQSPPHPPPNRLRYALEICGIGVQSSGRCVHVRNRKKSRNRSYRTPPMFRWRKRVHGRAVRAIGYTRYSSFLIQSFLNGTDRTCDRGRRIEECDCSSFVADHSDPLVVDPHGARLLGSWFHSHFGEFSAHQSHPIGAVRRDEVLPYIGIICADRRRPGTAKVAAASFATSA